MFLERDVLPEEKSEAEKVRRKAPRCWMSKDKKLYKRSFSGPYLLCVHPDASKSLLEELHEGVCGSHTRGRSLSHQAITQVYWQPDMQKEAQEYVRKCDQCQRFEPNIHQPGGVLILFTAFGLLLNRDWILQVLSLKQQEIKSIYWLAQIISLSESKLNLWLISGTQMSKSSSGRVLLLDSGFLIPSSLIMAFNSIAEPSGNTVPIWG